MRICYLCADRGVSLTKRNGSAAHVRSLVKALAGLGHEVALIASSAEDDGLGVPVSALPAPEFQGALRSLARSIDGEQARVASALGHLWSNLAVERVLAEALARGADLVYERYSPFAAAGPIVARRFGVPHLLEVNAPLAWEGSRYRRQALAEAAELMERAAFAATSLIIAVSAELRGWLVGAGVPAAKIAVVPNGVDTERFTPVGEACRDGLDGKFVVGFVGSLKAWHGVEILAAAFRRLARDERFHLLVVGDGPRAGVIDRLAAELPGRVTRRQAVAHELVPALLRAMDVAVAPYPALDRFYFSPLKVLEYMAAGRAVVASAIGQLSELLRDGETGLLVAPDDDAGLAAAIERLAGEDDLRRALGVRAADEARRRHGWSLRAAAIASLAERLR